MTSPYLTRPLHTQREAINAVIENAITFLIVDVARGQPYIREADIGQTFGAVVYDLATGQYDFRNEHGIWETPTAVIRMAMGETPEIVTEKVADAVLAYVSLHDIKVCPFLDRTMPDWRDVLAA